MTDANDEEVRTKNVAHYIISHSRPDKLGATKLNKVMWDADVAHYRHYGSTITGQESYIRMPQGPVPNRLKVALATLEQDGKIVLRPVETPVGVRHEFIAIEPMSPAEFPVEALEILHSAIDAICSLSAAEASAATHDALWDNIHNGQQMPIRAAAIIPGDLQPDDIDWALEAIRTAPE
ncbi:hypothetical protein X739_22265 [Mesorhizobium sp. LNHC220B00]|uniref:type II toxin-antitoxin system antitoxin SocA domain-containing protein n=1 Tax=Mesorhizobium sp. LNHC229A00 TaxID=1287240 RepID=UPI0003CDFF50|nr:MULTISPECIES: type II toxin-antitoxin system antitoxin SocA domain-containing protein [unclassified Mesorhizobium]ESY77335.1 hypothetical protein X741_34490 [Mesorhizobium sp. LNHC229A00]ESY84209.1 hypothetical protein X739_22265 [Mesorhizobium sp. LNHC220B00]